MTTQPTESTRGEAPSRRRRFPWLRLLLLLMYLALIGLGIVYETNAQRLLAEADRLEGRRKHMTAAVAYCMVLDKYPLAFATIEARLGAMRNEPALTGQSLIVPARETIVEEMLGSAFSPKNADWFPAAACAAASVLLALVFLTRIAFRPAVGFFALLLAIVAGAGLYGQLGWRGVAPLPEEAASAIEPVMTQAPALYLAGLVVLGLAMLMTLTAVRRRPRLAPELAAGQPAPPPRAHGGAVARAAGPPPPLRGRAGPVDGGGGGVHARLRRLQELMDEGLITQAEFDRRRREILSEI